MDRTRLPDRDQLFWLFFRFSGRVSRAAYFLAGLLLAIVQVFLLYRFTLVPQDSTQGQFWAMAFWAAVLISIWSNVALSVKRLHDLDKPGIIAATLFIPVISIIAFVLLCLFPGTPGPNRYGAATNQPK
ncbi:DUF805 domain-containing protein [Allomesorhizobium camelthorni]|uniref:DUF805 domain-containing protein n=1 Tax=Allomesorhizobium camelthorni TaxID=475069 RepID=UPI00198258C0|nr:DUF805 domain-containing protein [Mesorhizobium camelthorni]